MISRRFEEHLDEQLKYRQVAFTYLIECYNDEDPDLFRVAVANVHRALNTNIVEADHE